MTTARDIVKGTLRKIAVLGKGSSLDNDEAQDVLSVINGMIASWSVEGNLVYTETAESFPLTGATSYTIGTGGDFNTTRPTMIKAATATIGNTDYPLYMIDEEQYAKINLKSQGGEAQCLYYDENYPLGNIYIHPLQSSGTLKLYTRKPLDQFTNLDTVFSMPEEYRLAIEYNAAEQIAPEYDIEAPPTVKKMAHEYKTIIQVQNNRNNKHLSTLDDFPSRNYSDYDINRGY